MKPLYQLAILSSITLSLAAPKVITVAPPVPSNVPEWKDWDVFTSALLNSTNTYRSQHNASDVSWNETLSDFAASYLDDGECEFEHSGGPYGENLAIGYANVTVSVEAWGNERDKYDWDEPEFSKETGHFTQLVWVNTTDVGCGRRLCGERGWYLACEYWPRGNVAGQFKEEVGKEDEAAVVRPCRWAVGAAFGISVLVWL